jgi:hypothetical protein
VTRGVFLQLLYSDLGQCAAPSFIRAFEALFKQCQSAEYDPEFQVLSEHTLASLCHLMANLYIAAVTSDNFKL